MNKKIWVSIICAVLFLGGLGLALSEPIKHYLIIPHHVNTENDKLMKQSANDIKKNQKEKQNKKLDYSYDPNNVQSVGSEKPKNTIDPRYLNGMIIVPSVDIKLPILEGISNDNLNYGAGTMKPNQKIGQGNYALAGHYAYNKNALFTPLTDLPKDAKIYVTDKNKVYEYQVDKQFIVDPSHGEVIKDDQGDKIITLVTCTDVEGSERLIIRGHLNKVYDEPNEAPDDIKSAINN